MVHLKTDPMRRIIAIAHYSKKQNNDKEIRSIIESIAERDEGDSIILLGDFNRRREKMEERC